MTQYQILSKGSHHLPKRMNFYTLGKRPLTPPPPLGFTRSCCDFFDMNVKKCVNVRLDKIWRNSAKICGQNVKFTLKLWQFYPWKFFFCANFILSKGLQNYTNLQHKFVHMGLTPPPFTQCVKNIEFSTRWLPLSSS